MRGTSHKPLKVLVQLSGLYHQPFSCPAVCVKRVVFQVLTCGKPSQAVTTGCSERAAQPQTWPDLPVQNPLPYIAKVSNAINSLYKRHVLNTLIKAQLLLQTYLRVAA